MTWKISVTALFLLILCSELFAGAWPREKNEVYTKFSASRFEADEIFAAKGNRKIPGPEFEDESLSLYAEYGLGSKWTVISDLSYKSLSSKINNQTSRESGFADLWVYVKRGLIDKPVVLSLQFGIKNPLGYDRDNIPPLGEGQVDLEGRILLGRSFYPWPLYGNVELGYRRRNGVYSDMIPYLLETGVNITKPVLLIVALDGVENRSNDAASTTGNRSPNVFDQEYMKVRPSVVVMVKNGFSFDVYYERVITGGNTAAGDTIGVGLAWQGFIGSL